MRKNDDRKLAEEAYLNDRGRVTNKELAARFDVHPATVARWKKLDEWDLKLLQSVSEPEQSRIPPEEDFFTVDLRHIAALNERIDIFFQRKELSPTEILELAEAKYHLMNCVSIMQEQVRYPIMDAFNDLEDEFD